MNMGVKVLEERDSLFNGKIQVVRSLGFGTYIQVEGLTQSGGVVYEVWESTLKKVKHQSLTINHCLILGLGGGSVAKLVRKYWPDSKITGVDIDPVMVELGTRHLALGKVDMKIEIADAHDFVRRQTSDIRSQKFDLILVDTYQGDRYPEKFEEKSYLDSTRGLLVEGGMAVFNRVYWDEKRVLAHQFLKTLEKVFTDVLPFYPEANVMFLCRKG